MNDTICIYVHYIYIYTFMIYTLWIRHPKKGFFNALVVLARRLRLVQEEKGTAITGQARMGFLRLFSKGNNMYMYIYICMYICIYVYIDMCICTHIVYIYTHIFYTFASLYCL